MFTDRFEGNHLLQEQKDFNKSVITVPVPVECVFKEIIRHFAFVDLEKRKIQLSAVRKNVHYLCTFDKCTYLFI